MSRSWAELRKRIAEQLGESPAANPEQEAIWITEECSGHEGLAWLEIAQQQPMQRLEDAARDIARRRVLGEPLQYLLGHWHFGALDLRVTPDVLIPRPETEQLVAAVLSRLPSIAAGGHAFREPEWTAVDLGTGSGAIALSIAAARPDARVIAVDQSAAAIAVARSNAAGLGSAARHLEFREGNWFDAIDSSLEGQVRLVIANPPYLSGREWSELPDEVAAYEPRDALVSGATGMEDLGHIIDLAPRWLAGGGLLALEHGDGQQAAVIEALSRTRMFEEIESGCDLAGRPRYVITRRT
ncbi:MAG: peptide chain release factor N(5)-glutamine methyltransferase [Acidimicrobiia bacterium]